MTPVGRLINHDSSDSFVVGILVRAVSARRVRHVVSLRHCGPAESFRSHFRSHAARTSSTCHLLLRKSSPRASKSSTGPRFAFAIWDIPARRTVSRRPLRRRSRRLLTPYTTSPTSRNTGKPVMSSYCRACSRIATSVIPRRLDYLKLMIASPPKLANKRIKTDGLLGCPQVRSHAERLSNKGSPGPVGKRGCHRSSMPCSARNRVIWSSHFDGVAKRPAGPSSPCSP